MALLTVGMLMALAPPASAHFDTGNYRSLGDTSLALAATLVNAVNVCQINSAQPEGVPVRPVRIGCQGSYAVDASTYGGSAAADLDVYACVDTTCVVIPATLNRTGGYLEADAQLRLGDSAIVTVPRICVGTICATNEPQPITGVDPTAYFVGLFGEADEVEVFHPFSSEPITLDLGQFVIDGGGEDTTPLEAGN